MELFNHEVGWPSTTPDEAAFSGTLASARQHCDSLGWVMEEEDPAPEMSKVETPAHVEAGEFLISLWGARKQPEEEV